MIQLVDDATECLTSGSHRVLSHRYLLRDAFRRRATDEFSPAFQGWDDAPTRLLRRVSDG
jgi:hypothetical protein